MVQQVLVVLVLLLFRVVQVVSSTAQLFTLVLGLGTSSAGGL